MIELRNIYTGVVIELTVDEIYNMYKKIAEETGDSIKECFNSESDLECINGMVDYDETNDRFIFTEGKIQWADFFMLMVENIRS